MNEGHALPSHVFNIHVLSYRLRLQVICFLQVLAPKVYIQPYSVVWMTFISLSLVCHLNDKQTQAVLENVKLRG